MSTPQSRALHLIAEPDHSEPDTDWRSETLAAQWEPESQLVGALLWMPASRALPILELVPDTAIWRPMNRWVYVMYSRTVFQGPTWSALETLPRCWGGLAANLRSNTVSPLIDGAPR
jgi:hypothetical protein